MSWPIVLTNRMNKKKKLKDFLNLKVILFMFVAVVVVICGYCCGYYCLLFVAIVLLLVPTLFLSLLLSLFSKGGLIFIMTYNFL